jgi:hypothetical protein
MREQCTKRTASVGNRAPPHGGEASGGVVSSASDDDGGGFHARCASSAQNALRASGIARRRTEEKRAEALFPLRATTTAADSTRDARAVHKIGACYLDVKIVIWE